MNKFKICKKCLETKQLEDFHKCKNIDGRFNVCKKCWNKRTREWLKNNKVKVAFYQRKHGLKTRYGITLEQFNDFLRIQENKCAICGISPDPKGPYQNRNLHVDHCHKNNKVRGLLCFHCNQGIGIFMENPIILTAAIQYLKKHINYDSPSVVDLKQSQLLEI